MAIRLAVGTNAKPIIGLYGLPGSGKTKTALMLAKGFVGDMSKVVMIDTERGRGEAYAQDDDVGGYLVRPISDNFSPRSYGEAIEEAEKYGARALIIDSASHEWEGIGGVLSMAAANEEKGWKGQIVWTKPKMEHQREFVGRLLQSSFDLVIICCRAKHVMVEFIENGKKQMKRDDRPTPIQSDQFLGEVFAYGWLDEEHRFNPVRYTNDSLIPILKKGTQLNIDTGIKLAEWDKSRTKPADQPTASQAGISAGDGNKTTTPVIDNNGVDEMLIADYLAAIEGTSTLEDLRDVYGSAYTWAKSKMNLKSASAFEIAKNKRKIELS